VPTNIRKARAPRKATIRTFATYIIDDQQTMQLPFFALQEGDMDTIMFVDKEKRRTKIIPSSLGRPTVGDKDLLMYVYTLLRDRLTRGENPSPSETVQVYDFLRWAKREPSGAAYSRIAAMLIRLQSSLVTTEIPTGGRVDEHFFAFLAGVSIQRDSDETAIPLDFREPASLPSPIPQATKNSRVRKITVTLSDWCYRMLLGHETLAMSPAYLNIRSPLERRLYEVAWKHLGTQPEWRCSLEKLRLKVGYKRDIRHFRADLKARIAKGPIGDRFVYAMTSATQVVVRPVPKTALPPP